MISFLRTFANLNNLVPKFKSYKYFNKYGISICLFTCGYTFLNYEENFNVYLRFLRAFYIGVYNSLDYKWNLYGYEKDSLQYNEEMVRCHLRCAKRILNGCLENGGLYVKLGQGLAALNHILPQQYISTLELLHDKATPKTFDKVKKVFNEELGEDPNDLFLEFKETPFAAASLAQVHEAVSHSNERLAVKVQYYDLRSRFNADIKTIELILRIVEFVHPTFGFSWVLKDMKATLEQELDFENEAENSKRCARDLSSFRDVHVPKVYDNLSSKRILTTEFIDGVKINDVDALKKMKVDLRWVDRIMVQLFSHQIFHTGFVHADPHPGNILIRITEQKTPQFVILDHGLYETMSSNQKYNLASLVKSLIVRKYRDSEYYSKQLGVEDWETFGEIILQRPLTMDSLMNDFKLYQSKLTAKDIEYMKQKSAQHFDEIMSVLQKMPKSMILFIRNLNTVRSICQAHGDPINRYFYMTDSAIRATFSDRKEHIFLLHFLKLYLQLEIFKWKIRMSNFREIITRFIIHLLNYFGYGLSLQEIERIYSEHRL